MRFRVHHFLACESVSWQGPAGVRSSRTLEGVNFRYDVPPDTEFPFQQDEFWLYARIFLIGEEDRDIEFRIRIVHHLREQTLRKVGIVQVSPVRLTVQRPVANVAWAIRPAIFPAPGLFEFQLCELRVDWQRRKRIVAREYVRIERGTA